MDPLNQSYFNFWIIFCLVIFLNVHAYEIFMQISIFSCSLPWTEGGLHWHLSIKRLIEQGIDSLELMVV